MSKRNLLEEYKKNFRHLVEYTNAGGAFNINEDGEEDTSMINNNPNAMGDDMSMMGNEPGMDGNTDPNAMGDDMSMMGNETGMDGNGVEGFNPQGDNTDMMGGNESNEEEEEVIDVDELVDSQDETSDKIDKLASSFDRLIDKLNVFKDMVDSSNEKIESLKAEMEKRNPTPVEKLSLRSKDGYPFAQSPDEYWQTKEKTSNYSTEDDNNGADDTIFQITKDDIDNFNDYASISKTLDDEYNLRDMFGY